MINKPNNSFIPCANPKNAISHNILKIVNSLFSVTLTVKRLPIPEL